MTPSNNLALRLNDHLSETGLARWIAALSIPDAPVRRAGVRTTLHFLALRMPTLPTDMALSFFRGMDLSKEVKIVRVESGELLAATRTFYESPYRLFFTRVGRNLENSGINPNGRHTLTYRAFMAFDALESFTCAANDFWTARAPGQSGSIAPHAKTFGVLAAGGNTQLLIPSSAATLRVEHVSMREH